MLNDSFLQCYEDQLKALAEAIGTSKVADIATAGAALLAKILTGSSVAEGVPSKAARLFGHWLADTPDSRLQQASLGLNRAVRDPEALRQFAALVEPLLRFGLRCIQTTLERLDAGQVQLGTKLDGFSDDFEALLDQSLRAKALAEGGHTQVSVLVEHALQQLSESEARTVSKPGFPGASAVEPQRVLDFFVSYTGVDAHWAEWIAWVVEAEGYRVKLQKWDFRPGSNFVLEMHSAAMQAERTIAVLSAAYFDSPFGRTEWAAAFQADPTGERRKLLPTRVEDCKPPGLLAAIVYIDLFGKGEDDARQALLAGVRIERAKPLTAPAFPGSAALGVSPQAQVAPKPMFPGDLPHVWNVPFQPSRFFVGREALLEQLHAELQSNPARRAVLWGLGGIGKTQLAVEYAYAHKLVDFDAILWVPAYSVEALHANLAALCSAALRLPEGSDKEQSVRLNAALRWLREHSRWLLVLDGVDTEAAADAVIELVQVLPSRHVIVTSQRSIWPSDFSCVEVDKLPPDVSARFLLRRTAQGSKQALGTEEEALAVARDLDGLPLALEQAAAYMLHKRMRFANYSSNLSDALRFTLKGGTSHQMSVHSAWLVSEAALDLEAKTVLRLVCWLSSDPIRRDLFAVDRGEAFREALMLSGCDVAREDIGAALERGILQLADLSLLDCNEKQFSMHRLVAAVQRERLLNEESVRWATCALRMVAADTACDPYDVRSEAIIAPMQNHIATLVGHAEKLAISEPTTLIMHRLAGFLDTHGRYHEAEPLMRRGLVLVEKDYGTTHPNVAILLNNLAALLQTMNRFAEAEPLVRRALAIDEKSYRPDDPKVALSLNNLASLLQATNRFTEAEPLVRRALQIDEDSYGPDHPVVAIRLNNLALLLQATNRFVDAESLMRQALAINEENFGPDHPKVARDLNNLALLLQATQRLAEAEPLLQRAQRIVEDHLPADHPLAQALSSNLAQLLESKSSATSHN